MGGGCGREKGTSLIGNGQTSMTLLEGKGMGNDTKTAVWWNFQG